MPVVFFGASPLLPYSRHSPLLALYRLAAAVPQVEMVEVPREVVGVPVMGAAVLQQEVVAVIRGLAILEVAAVVIRLAVAVAALAAADMR